MPGMDDFYVAHARQRQRQWQRDAERARMARVAKRAARQRAARETAETPATARSMPPAGGVDAGRPRRPTRSPGRLMALRRMVALRRAAGYALLEAGLRLLTPPSRRSRVDPAGMADSMPARGSKSP